MISLFNVLTPDRNMPKYRLSYFPLRYRAEPARMLFFMKRVEFGDNNVGIGADWRAVKDTFPLKQVPVLEVDDVVITQTRAIIRYLGREFGYYGKSSLEGAQIDCVMDVCEDVTASVAPIYNYQGPGELDKEKFKAENKDVLKKFIDVFRPDLLSNLQTLYEMNKNADGFFVGEQLTIADLYFFAVFDFVEIFTKDPFAGFPKMADLYEKIKDHEKVAEWLKKTDYGNNPMDLFKEK